ncbi:hypothetical protein PBY51_009010 [Eleginops maclovinus]|uniref:Uncharacterized protein n=1 Tax=Eleginops maclovinus TaxID=56733 RepID=A0AAN7WVH3_ELEMC|nr:hypothetical protein PBY51_009010 [Eleginops maclovinus]
MALCRSPAMSAIASTAPTPPPLPLPSSGLSAFDGSEREEAIGFIAQYAWRVGGISILSAERQTISKLHNDPHLNSLLALPSVL